MRYAKVDERDTVEEEGVAFFRVAFEIPGDYVEMYDVECDDVEKVIVWAKEFLKTSEFGKDARYYIAVRNSSPSASHQAGGGVGLIWLTPRPELTEKSGGTAAVLTQE